MHSELFLNGEWRSTSTQFAVHNPATGAVLAMVSDAGHDELEAALSAAKTAFARWRLSLAQSGNSC